MKKRDKLALIRKFYPVAHTTIDSVNNLIDSLKNWIWNQLRNDIGSLQNDLKPLT